MIREPVEATKLRLRDIINRRERGLPVLDDEQETLERALGVIEDLQRARDWRQD